MAIQSCPAGPIQMGNPAGPLHLQPVHQPPQLHDHLANRSEDKSVRSWLRSRARIRDRSSRSDSSIAAPTRTVTGQTILFSGDQSGRWPKLCAPYPIEHMFDCQVSRLRNGPEILFVSEPQSCGPLRLRCSILRAETARGIKLRPGRLTVWDGRFCQITRLLGGGGYSHSSDFGLLIQDGKPFDWEEHLDRFQHYAWLSDRLSGMLHSSPSSLEHMSPSQRLWALISGLSGSNARSTPSLNANRLAWVCPAITGLHT